MLIIDDYLLYKLLIEPPLTMARIVGESILNMCNRELTDEGAIHEKLLELQLRYELGEVTEEEYQKEEAQLMARLREIRKAKQEEMWGKDEESIKQKSMGQESKDKAQDSGFKIPPKGHIYI